MLASLQQMQSNNRKHALLDKYTATGYLSPYEAQELKGFIENDTHMEEGVKLLLIFALVAIAVTASR